MEKRKIGVLFLLSCFFTFNIHIFCCTVIVAGKEATKDGSVIISHTDACENSRLMVVPAKKYKKGAKAPVYLGLQDPKIPLGKFGKIIGYIPQVEKTYAYFHSGYSHINEHQLAIGESTTTQRKELHVNCTTGGQIITIEQAMVFALQRCKKAESALELIASLIEKYGFLPSCANESETIAIADPQEVWILEIFSVGPGWSPNSGKLGAIWAAQRVPDDHIAIVPNWSIIKEIDLSKPDKFRASKNYKQFAIERGWYNPKSGKPFIYQEVYTPILVEWGLSRLWLFYSTYCKSLKNWPNKYLDKLHKNYDLYHQYLESLSFYPFSAKPDKKITIQDIMKFQRSTFEGTIYDMTADHDWLVPNGKGGFVKSPLATPFPTPDMRALLDINFRRNVSKGGYGMIAQLRSWLPDPVGGIYWYFVDNQYVSTYIPIYTGVQQIHPSYKIFNPDQYTEDSVRWGVDFVDNLLYLKFQEAIKDVRKVRDPLEATFFEELSAIDNKAVTMFKQRPSKAKRYVTQLTWKRMDKIHKMYLKLRDQLITKYTNNHVRP